MDTLPLPEDDPDRRQLLEDFRDTHADLARTVSDLEAFDEIAGRLLWAIRRTYVRLVNSLADADRNIHWRRNYSWILVGGQVLDRGFTVEGLTVTYMPRGPGVGNADTIQQRARFLGYKRSYLGYCRVFLEQGVVHLYRTYVRHEEDMRARLIAHIGSGRPLSEFRRVFLLDQAFRPTRQSVIDIDYSQTNISLWLVRAKSTARRGCRGEPSYCRGFCGAPCGQVCPRRGPRSAAGAPEAFGRAAEFCSVWYTKNS